MRARKSREVNIFSASVVDLFASGLGVFLIVAIIALANQKKETSRALEGGQTGTVINTPENSKLVGKEQNFANSDAPLISALESKIEKLEASVDLKTKENLSLRKKIATNSDSEDKTDYEFLLASAEKAKKELAQKVSELEAKLEQKELEKMEIKRELTYKQDARQGEQGVANNFDNFQIGSRFKLQNVHFYPGTEKAIEPYSSREVEDLALFLKKNPAVSIEISGHIYETKKAIEAGKADDEYNLSGRRAQYVCQKLEEFGVNPKRLRCLGYGATRPLYLTDDQYSEEAQLNRRVEVEILTK